MRIRCFAKTKALTPIQQTRADDRHFHDRMQIETFDEGRRVDRIIPSSDGGQTRLCTQIKWELRNLSPRHFRFQRRKFPHHHCGPFRTVEENSISRKDEIGAQIRLITADERARSLKRIRNGIQTIFINLTKCERANEIQIRNTTETARNIPVGKNSSAPSALPQTIAGEQRLHLNS